MKLLIGADPELFAAKDGKLVNAHGLVKGTKKQPHPVSFGAVQVDGMALEFNIAPAEDEDMFVHNIAYVMRELASMVPDHKLAIVPTMFFTEEEMEEFPAQSLELGCDPDLCAYTMELNPPPDADMLMRTAAGHVHLGWGEEPSLGDAAVLVKQLDVFLGLPSLLRDPDEERRKLYGKAGAFRIKPYGVEYRTLSNYWLKDDKLMRNVYRNAKNAFELLAEEGVKIFERFPRLQGVINEADRGEAEQCIAAINATLPENRMIKV